MLSILTNLHIPKDEKLIVSVSGGVDSMVLLHKLLQTPYALEVVHFNHQKRQQSMIEKDLVKAFCEKNKIPFHYYLIETNTGNFHDQAHQLRKHYLKDTAKISKAKYILTAHHLDDLYESILIKLTRGSNLLGYAGMQQIYEKKGLYFVKPLLFETKESIKAYAMTHDVPYLDDESNDQDTYLRNRYRHTVLPIMKQENENLLKQAIGYHKQLSHAFSFIRQTTIHTLNNANIIDLELYKMLDVAIQDDIIAYLLENKKLNVSYDIIIAIKSMLLSDKPNQMYPLSNDFIFNKAYNEAKITKKHLKNYVKIQVKTGDNTLPNNDIFTFLDNSNVQTEEFTKLCYNKLAFPLWLRHRLDGDKLAYDFGHKKLKDLLIDKKVPASKRDALWVLVDHNNQILWVEDYYSNQTLGNSTTVYFKIKESTHA